MTDPQPRPRCVLMTADTLGGVWTYALELSRAFEASGVEVALATMGAPLSPEQRVEARKLSNLAVFESCFKLEWMGDPWEEVRDAGEWLLQLEARVKPDIVHLNGYVHGALAWKAPVLMVAHSCVLSWWQAARGEPAPSDWDRYRREVARGLAAADLVVAPSQAMLDALCRYYGAVPAALVVPNGRDPALFRPGVKKSLVLAAGRLWDEAKNIRLLEAAAPLLRWPVYIAGDDRHPDGRRAHFEGVHCLGSVSSDALAYWYGRASIYVLPARYEPFGLSVLEAALAGCALVLGDIPSLREIWEDAARYVPPGDADALAGEVNRLIGNPMLRARMRARARARAALFNAERMADNYLAVYRSLLRRAPTALAS